MLPGDELEPYDLGSVSLRASGAPAVEDWGRRVRFVRDSEFPASRFVFLAASAYRGAVSDLNVRRVAEPLRGLSLARRLKWLTLETREPKAVAS